MSEYIDEQKTEFTKVIEFFKKEISSLRVGRASPVLVENIKVDAYGTATPLIQLASIQIPEPRSLVIQPWDKNLAKEITKAISASDLGVSPVLEGEIIRINFPPLTEETRKEVVKKLHQKLEEAKVSLRNHREKIKEGIVRLERDKEISEDDKYKRIEELDQLVKENNTILKELADKKETEIMSL
ncbi:ribosome recycling factor [Patescibacteria group bacterium]|nr:ribosome recycling factor [Patescibacteria group bacterium]